MRPLLLDCFCGGGGASAGYYQAGFDVVGVDIRPSKRYPFPCVQADALEFLACAKLDRVAMIHASPPCQQYTVLRSVHGRTYPDLLAATRAALQATGKPWVIENVIGAPVHHGIMLCGTMFPPLRVYRHRWFETSSLIFQPYHPPHRVEAGGGKNVRNRKSHYEAGGFVTVTGHVGSFCGPAMGIEWMTGEELSQAIPPAFTKWIGEAMRCHH